VYAIDPKNCYPFMRAIIQPPTAPICNDVP
jgi:hypothetical protein